MQHRSSLSSSSLLAVSLCVAAALWGVFWLGDKVSAALFDFARPQVDAIYGLKSGQSGWCVGLLLLFLIGPAEELFWRGYVQHGLVVRFLYKFATEYKTGMIWQH